MGTHGCENREGNTLTNPSANLWLYKTQHGHTYEFNSAGKITLRANDFGFSWMYNYVNNVLHTVTDSYGTTFTFTFSGQQLQKIVTPLGEFEYHYTNGLLGEVVFPYLISTKAKLAAIVAPA